MTGAQAVYSRTAEVVPMMVESWMRERVHQLAAEPIESGPDGLPGPLVLTYQHEPFVQFDLSGRIMFPGDSFTLTWLGESWTVPIVKRRRRVGES